MTDIEKLEAFKILLDHYWNEWKDKVGYQWKLSLAIWGVLLSAISTFLVKSFPINSMVLYFFAFVLIVIHTFFTAWIKVRLIQFRADSKIIQEQIIKLTDKTISVGSTTKFGRIWIVEVIQVLITILLCGIFISIQ